MTINLLYKVVCLECDYREESGEKTESVLDEEPVVFCQGVDHRSETGHRLVYLREGEIIKIDDLRDEEIDRLNTENKLLIELVNRAKNLGLNLWKQEDGGAKYRMSGFIRGDLRQGMFEDIGSVVLQIEKEEKWKSQKENI